MLFVSVVLFDNFFIDISVQLVLIFEVAHLLPFAFLMNKLVLGNVESACR